MGKFNPDTQMLRCLLGAYRLTDPESYCCWHETNMGYARIFTIQIVDIWGETVRHFDNLKDAEEFLTQKLTQAQGH